MSPSTSAIFAAAANEFALVMFREFATTLYPRFRNASTSPAPIPREAPVTIAVFAVFAICKLPYCSVRRRLSPSLLCAQLCVNCSSHKELCVFLLGWSESCYIHSLRIWHSRDGGFKFRHSGNIHVRPNSLLALPRHT